MFKRGWVVAKAKVVDASFGDVIQAGPLIYANYVVDVVPTDAEAFRTLVKNVQAVGITILQEGDSATVRYDPEDHRKMEIVEKGDPRFDPKTARRIGEDRIASLLAHPPGSSEPTGSETRDPDDAKLDALLRDIEGG